MGSNNDIHNRSKFLHDRIQELSTLIRLRQITHDSLTWSEREMVQDLWMEEYLLRKVANSHLERTA